MQKKYKNINKIGIATIAGTMGVELVNFLLIPIMTRALGTSGYGTISIYTAWCSIIIAICGLQTTQSIVYIITDKDESQHKDYYASMLACSSFAFFFTTMLFAIVSIACDGILGFPPALVFVMFLQSFGNYCVNYANTIFKQEQKPINQVVVSLLVAVSTALLSIALVYHIKEHNMKYWGRIIGYAIPYFTIGFALASYYIVPRLRNIKLSYVREYLPLCIPVIIHSLASMVFSQSDRVMLGYMSSTSDAGIYSFTHSIASLLSVEWVTLNSIYQPFFFAYMKNNDFYLIEEKTKNLIELFTSSYVIFLMIIPELMAMYGGRDFESAKQFLPVLSLGVYFNFLYMFNSNFEIFHKETLVIAKATTVTAITNIILNIILIPNLTILGASIATLFSCIILFGIHLVSALSIAKEKKVRYVFNQNIFILGSIAAVATTLLYYILQDRLIIRIIISAIIFVYALLSIFRRKSIL